VVCRSDDVAGFMALEARHLRAKFGTTPVHSPEEMSLLAGRFPANIALWAAYEGDEMVSGVLLYDSGIVAHAQYIGTTARGLELNGLDVIIDTLLGQQPEGRRYFDFGISTEQGGRLLNEGLISNKESYGARATVHDFYEMELG
jgi:hypothetical protein